MKQWTQAAIVGMGALGMMYGERIAENLGAEAVCFGDIDIQQNRQWEEDRCKAAGLTPCFPLWQMRREPGAIGRWILQ